MWYLNVWVKLKTIIILTLCSTLKEEDASIVESLSCLRLHIRLFRHEKSHKFCLQAVRA